MIWWIVALAVLVGVLWWPESGRTSGQHDSTGCTSDTTCPGKRWTAHWLAEPSWRRRRSRLLRRPPRGPEPGQAGGQRGERLAIRPGTVRKRSVGRSGARRPDSVPVALVAELADAEARVLLARRFHNDAVRDTWCCRAAAGALAAPGRESPATQIL